MTDFTPTPEVTARELEAWEEAYCDWNPRTENAAPATAFHAGYQAAKEFYVGRGYTPRSMLRAQAATQKVCPICGKDQA